MSTTSAGFVVFLALGALTLQPRLVVRFGGPAEDTVRDVWVAGDGLTHVAGGSASPGLFGTLRGPHDAYVAALNVDGTVRWATRIGGPNYDRAYAVEVGPDGSVYVAGRAGADFPTTPGVVQPSFAGGPRVGAYGSQDGFVCQLRPGGAVSWCTYLGASDESIVRDIALGSDGSVFAVTAQRQGVFPSSVISHWVNSRLGADDVVLAKLAADGSRVIWARYLGGSGIEGNQASVRTDPNGNAYVLLTTQSHDAATTHGLDSSRGGPVDVYVAKVHGITGLLIWATYLGGSDIESTETHELAVHRDGSVVVATSTQSPDLPIVGKAVQATYGGGVNDVLVARLDASGRLVASTYLGGSGHDRAEGVALDGDGAVYFTGTTTSSNFPVTRDALLSQRQGARDAIVVHLSPQLDELRYASYLGGDGEEYGRAAAVTPKGVLAIGGQTDALRWPLAKRLAGAQPGGVDGFVALFRTR